MASAWLLCSIAFVLAGMHKNFRSKILCGIFYILIKFWFPPYFTG